MADQPGKGKGKKKGRKGSGGLGGGGSGSGESLMKRLNIGKIYKGKKKTQAAAASSEDSGRTSVEEVEDSSPPPAPPPPALPPLAAQEEVGPELEEADGDTVVLGDTEKQEEEAVAEVETEAAAPKEEGEPPPAAPKQEDEDEDEEVAARASISSRDATTSTSSDVEAVTGGGGGVVGSKRECLYKILVIGELGTGKTSIIKRYVHQFFSQHYRATIGVDFALKVLNWDQSTIVRLQLWDIAGQERFGNMTRVYYKEAVGAFIVFDVTRNSTFEAVVKWKQDLDSKVQLPDGSPIPCVLLANKCDQQKEGLVNNPNKMEEYCKENNFTAWYETSAKENINIEDAAKTLVAQILKNDTSSENGRGGVKDQSRFPLEGHHGSGVDSKSCTC